MGSSVYSVPVFILDMMLWIAVSRGMLVSVRLCIAYAFVVDGAVVKHTCACPLSVVGSERSFRVLQNVPQTYQNVLRTLKSFQSTGPCIKREYIHVWVLCVKAVWD